MAIIMGLQERLGLKAKDTTNPNEGTIKLTKSELEALIVGLGEATFKGKQVESVFRLAIKLQDELKKLK
jgi:hypothetical protein